MTVAGLARDAWVIGVLASFVSVALFAVLGAWVSALTVVRARRRAQRAPRRLDALRLWYSESDLAQLDQAFERILAEESGIPPKARML